MIEIHMRNVYSVLSDYTDELEQLLAVPRPNYWFSPSYKDPANPDDGKYHFLKVPSMKVPTGLIHIVEEYFKESNIEYKVVDHRLEDYDCVNDTIETDDDEIWAEGYLKDITLRDYQWGSALAALLDGRGIIELATGLGKTEVAIAITKFIGLRTLFLVHKKDLLVQTHERFCKRLDRSDIGMLGDSQELNIESDIVIATFQTLESWFKDKRAQYKKFLNSFNIAFFDECHHASSNTFYKVGMYMHNCYWRYGLSGTPLRKDELSNMKLMAITGPIVYSKLAKEGIEEGHLCEIDVKIIDVYKPPEIGEASLTWQQEYELGIVRSDSRNTHIANRAKDHFIKGDRIMILVRMIEHGKILQRMLSSGRNIPAVFLSGISETWEREKMKKKFNDEGGFVLISSPIFDEGVDIPEINVLVKANAGKSEVKLIQNIGRGLRKKRDDSKLTVYDFNDMKWKYLSKHSTQRIKTYRKEGYLNG